MVHDYYVKRVRALNALRDEELSRIKTRDEALEYRAKVIKAVKRTFGRLPKRSPLNPEVTGRIETKSCVVEKVLFESRPGCLVTANLYLPKNLSRPAPGVVSPCGHAMQGKAYHLYQEYCQRLARSGFIVLIYDPFDQGERNQYYGMDDEGLTRSCTSAHNMIGKQMELLGEFFGTWRVWDGIRALDYLLTRPEVDPTRLGVTGNSGGGTLTEWLWALDDRFTMAAPSCFVTTFLANLENEIPQDCEQYPPGILKSGLEMSDLIIAQAPKPVLLLGQTYDYFDKRGLKKAYAELKRFYRILGHPENIELFVGPHGHGYFRENQEAMVRFFTRHAGIGGKRPFYEIEVLDEKFLTVTPRGNTVASGSMPIFKLVEQEANRLIRLRKPVNEEGIKKRLRLLLGLPKRRTAPHYRILRPEAVEGTRIARYAIETEDSIRAIMRRPVTKPEEAYSLDGEDDVGLYIPHLSAQSELHEYFGDEALVEGPAYALDPRGMGESMPEGGAEAFFDPYGMDYMFHGFGILLGESYLGRRVYDVLSTMDLLVARGAQRIDLYGRGQGAIIALFSCLFHKRAGKLVLKNGPTSFEDWVREPIVTWPAASFPRGVLRYFDLPECIRLLGDRVRIVDPWDPHMRTPNSPVQGP